MSNWSFDPACNAGTLAILGDMTIGHVTALKQSLLEAFARAGQVTVDVSSVTAVDVAGVQLLCASHRFASGRGQQMFLRLGDNRPFLQFLDEVGFARDLVCGYGNADQCLWASMD